MQSHDFIWAYWKLLKQANETKSIVHDCLGKQYNLTQLQFNVLVKIDNLEEKSISALARIFQKDHGNISKICTVLEEKGYIYREKSSEDNRVVYLYLTDQGHEYMEVFDHCITDAYKEMSKNLSVKEQEKFLESMAFINKCFGDSKSVVEFRNYRREQKRLEKKS